MLQWLASITSMTCDKLTHYDNEQCKHIPT